MTHDWFPFITRDEFRDELAKLNERMNSMATQADVDALTQTVQTQTTQLGQVASDVTAAQTKIQDELNSLEAQINAGGAVNLDGLKTAVDALGTAITPLDGAVQALGALTPAPAAPTPTPTPTPAPAPTP
jgi:hypothetical protein